MIIIPPNCEYIPEINHIQHVTRCAGVCYGNDIDLSAINDDNINEHLYNKLLKRKHFSPFRHSTHYYIIPTIFINIKDFNPLLCGIYQTKNGIKYFISVNGQYFIENSNNLAKYDEYLCTKENYIEEISKLDIIDKLGCYGTLRYTFAITTQISTSRELNRVSPNNICEQSTRYCKFTIPKFDNDVTICAPHWLNIFKQDILESNTSIVHDAVYIKEVNSTIYYICGSDNIMYTLGDTWKININPFFSKDYNEYIYNQDSAFTYIKGLYNATNSYKEMIDKGMFPQDARGVLPLDTATKVIYTYTHKEWKHIIDLRVNEITGPAHPNAKLIISCVEKILMDEAKKLLSTDN